MTNIAPTSADTKPPRKRRWLRRLLVILLIFVGLPAGYYFYARWSLHVETERAIAETDQLDPHWRFEDMEADRKTIPDEENSYVQVVEVIRLLGRGGAGTPGANKHHPQVFGELPPTAELNAQQIEIIRDAFEKSAAALVEARKLKDFPRGRFPIVWDRSGIWVLLPDHQEVRYIVDLLHHDAMLKAHFGDPDDALESCQALLNAARSLENDPFVISMYIHIACDAILVYALERILAQGYPKDEPLKQMQERLRTERDELPSDWIASVRGERAESYRFFEPLLSGRLRWMDMTKTLHMRVGAGDYLMDYLPSLFTKDYPQHLRHRNEMVAAARLPLEQQLDRFQELKEKVSRKNWNPHMMALSDFLPLFPPDLSKACQIHLRGQALLRSAEAGLACEHFRRAKERWPESLAELVKAGLLDAVPTDPYDGQPLRFVRRNDGVTVYAVGPDKQDNGGDIRREGPDDPGVDIGFRLWDPKHRRQPPRPPVALEP
jgi:hypothetical protein